MNGTIINRDMKKKKVDHVITRFDHIQIPLSFRSIRRNLEMEGFCIDPQHPQAEIVVDKRLGKRRKLNVLIEEVTHAFFYDQPEYKVRKFSSELGKVIYNRFVKQNSIENID
tara:strand:- start:103 stop:438 length:336 start_codon:yes stop_codon:yes gene_type:complete